MQRATIIVQNSIKLGCDKIISAKDLIVGNPLVNCLFVAHLFKTKSGLEVLSSNKSEIVPI